MKRKEKIQLIVLQKSNSLQRNENLPETLNNNFLQHLASTTLGLPGFQFYRIWKLVKVTIIESFNGSFNSHFRRYSTNIQGINMYVL